ncbi:MAG: YqaJ viral recombinase family protein [Candidatus Bathyarchaeia archaeon]
MSERYRGIGASETAAVLGISPFLSNTDLWELKTGLREAKDLSDNEKVQNGIRLENPLRELFRAEHPEYEVEYYPYDVLYQTERPYLRATLDGELIEKETGRRGVLEIKTALLTRKEQWEHWKDAIPPWYLAQNYVQMYCTNYDFVILYAKLQGMNGDSQLRHYKIERAERREEIDWVVGKADDFWDKVQRKERPAKILPEL